jgi:sugar transferase (PEP-CTERM system associated)
MSRLSQTSTGTALFVLDALAVFALWLAAVHLWAHANAATMVYPLCDLLLLYAMGLYRREMIQQASQALARLPLVVLMGAALGVATSALLRLFAPDEERHAMLFGLAIGVSLAAALTARLAVHVLLRRHVLRRRLLIVGAGQRAWELLLVLGREGSSLHDDVTLVHDPSQPPVDPRLLDERIEAIVRAPDFDVVGIARKVRADLVIVAPDDRRGMDLERLLACKKAGFPVLPYLTFLEREIRRVDLKRMELGWLVYSDGFSFGFMDRFLKRAFDLCVSSLVLLLTAPLILAGMLAIRWEGAAPIFYRQERVTQDGRVFRILKLRTMRVDAEAQGAPVWAAVKDARVTRAGAVLRRTRVDELPQLWNILRGEMSFVGPRPERPAFVEELAAQIPLYHERHMVKAGLTGWAQINYPYGASIDDARSKLSYDLYYVKNFSILFDFVILLQTLRAVLFPAGVR